MESAPLYKRAMKAKNIQWLGLKLSPPLLLGMNDEKDTDAQDREWENVEKKNGFYPLGETPTHVPREIREAIKALKEMQSED